MICATAQFRFYTRTDHFDRRFFRVDNSESAEMRKIFRSLRKGSGNDGLFGVKKIKKNIF